jgi:hypothetical protein
VRPYITRAEVSVLRAGRIAYAMGDDIRLFSRVESLYVFTLKRDHRALRLLGVMLTGRCTY